MSATTTTDPLAKHQWLMRVFGPAELADFRTALNGPLTDAQAVLLEQELSRIERDMPGTVGILNASDAGLPVVLQRIDDELAAR